MNNITAVAATNDDPLGADGNFRFESRRLSTFKSWPSNAKVGAGKIARAGFYHTGKDLEVRCMWCECTITDWEFGDQVMAKHRRASPDCPFVKNLSNNVPLNGSANSLSCPPSVSQLPGGLEPSTETSQITSSEDRCPELAEESLAVTANHSSPHSAEPRSETDRLNMYRCEERRYLSFIEWPHDFVSPSDLARAGFLYTGSNDCVQCAFCQGYVSSWEAGDLPFTVHASFFPDCPLVLGADCGNKPMSRERQSQIDLSINPSNDSAQLDADVSGSALVHQDSVTASTSFGVPNQGYDETGIRPNIRDFNSVGGKGVSALQIKNSVATFDSDEAIGVIKHSGPAHPRYATVESRIRTFRHWPPALKQRPKELSDAGFYYIGLSDHVKCFYCAGGLRNWQPDDDPWIEHSRWFSKCGFVRLIKGDGFIASCVSQKPPEFTPEVSMVTRDPASALSEAELESLMSSIEVQEALSFGLDPGIIRRTLSKKWEETGSGFSDGRQLIEASFKFLRHDQVQHDKSSDGQNDDEAKSKAAKKGADGKEEDDEAKPAIPQSMQAQASSSTAADLEKENRRLREERTCKICMDNEIGVVFLPCGHLICCFQCAPALATCPLCRETIHGTVKTYLS